MGDGGVACMPFQHSIMDRLSAPDKALCNNGNNGFNSKSLKLAESEPKKKKMKKVKKVVTVRKAETLKSEVALERKDSGSKELENGEICPDKSLSDEVEEGELGTLKWPTREADNGGLASEKPRRSEIEKEGTSAERWRKPDREKEEYTSGKSRKGEVEREDITSERGRRGEGERGEFRSWRGSSDEIEKGEFIPDRWHRGELTKDDFSYSKSRRYESGKDRGWKYEFERTPPLGKYSGDDMSWRKELSRSGSQHSKNQHRLDAGQERIVRLSSKIVDEDGLYRGEHSNGKNQRREYFSGNRLKRHGHEADSDSSDRDHDRKHYGDYTDYTSSKSRRLSDDSGRAVPSEQYHSRRSPDSPYRNSSTSRAYSMDKYSSRHQDSSLSSRVAYDRAVRSPVHSEQAPRDRSRHHDHRDRSPVRRDRSPYNREKSPYYHRKTPYSRDSALHAREKSPHVRDRSPHERNHHSDRRNRSPAYGEQSPQDRVRHHEKKDQNQSNLERSPLTQGRSHDNKETGRNAGTNEKLNSQGRNKAGEEKLSQRDSSGKETYHSAKESEDRSTVEDSNMSFVEKVDNNENQKDDQSQRPITNCDESIHIAGAPPEELVSMEEDMDICDTPPHVPVVADSTAGRWIYLDYFGIDCGPSTLSDLKKLVKEGLLCSDHFIKHLDSDRWVTVENAVSPLVTLNFSSIVPDSITQLVSPPEAPGNMLVDTGDAGQLGNQTIEETSVACASEPLGSFCIDQRVEALLEGFTVVPGEELEAVGEALQMMFDHEHWLKWQNVEDFLWHQACSVVDYDQKADEDGSQYSGANSAEFREMMTVDKEYFGGLDNPRDWFPGHWACKGGDWKRNEEMSQDRLFRKKLVLNDGFPLCQMPKSGYEDPRWQHKDELYYPSYSKKLDLPPWTFSLQEERSDSDGASRAQVKPASVRGVRGTALPVVRINACVVKDHGSFVSESRSKSRGKDRYSSKSGRPYASSDKRSSVEPDSRPRTVDEHNMRGSRKTIAAINTPKDRVCSVHDLQLHLGDWYYLDGAGREHGPVSFSDLQVLVDHGTIQKNSSVFRKFDKLWVPVTSSGGTSEAAAKVLQENTSSCNSSSEQALPEHGTVPVEAEHNGSSFHSKHPQFIGYMRGKLHELVMRSYKSREFAATINEVLDPWINAKQPKKDTEKHIYRKSDAYLHGSKRARLSVDESEEESEIEEDIQREEPSFEDLCKCAGATVIEEEAASSENAVATWALLDHHVLARIFHFLRTDVKSLAFASSTCKHWRAVVTFYKNISVKVDLSSLGPSCGDPVIWNIMDGYDKAKISSLVLTGCSNITPDVLEEILHSFPCLSYIDIRGCSQFGDLAVAFSNVTWIKGQKNFMNSKIKSLKQLTTTDSSYSQSKGMANDMDDFSELKDYFASVGRRDSAGQAFRSGFYKRSKLFDARKSSSILSRDARVRRWDLKNLEKGYKRMKEFLVSSMKEIMKENTFDFFIPKVAELESRIKNGYYIRRGISSIKEDISRMCRDAIKAKNRGDAGDMNHIITLFIQLATRLEESSKSPFQRDEMIKSWKDDSYVGSSTSSKYKKKLSKAENEWKYISRSNGLYANGVLGDGEYASDREIRRRLSKLNRTSVNSESETSDEFDESVENSRSDSETTASETESDAELKGIGVSRGDGSLAEDEGVDSLTDDREWGARMTKASLVPPVTRKYEVIDQYVIVADEENVRSKMQVSLPEHYAEKLDAQKNGAEELDMELPEVKDYKPRKQLGYEVIEQEVYGIDPYTHNLLLDSMPEELDWTLLDKHLFIEDVLLCTLNRQARHFTGTGNTPMIYPLQPVVEEIERMAEEDHDIRTVKMCQGILRAIDSRHEDKYVAYRKGLGVVCNKEGGFEEDDFVVEFLGEVYPTWKWFEKQDGIRSLQKNNKEAPEFYNIYLERPKGDADGYDLVVVDAMHKANYASRICHSCRPNCEAKVTAVDGQYQIGIYSVRKIQFGEEVTFDYNSVTESKEEYEASVCLCGSQVCRGSYLNLTGEGSFQKILTEWHGILDRHQLMIEACEMNSVSEEDYYDLGRAGLGSCLLGGLPDWLVAYAARLVRFINFERTKLPQEILRHNLEEKRKYFLDICLEVEKSDAEVQAEGVYNQRLQNLAVTLDKVRYVMRCAFGDPKNAPPPLERLGPDEIASLIWSGEGSLVEELLECISPHTDDDTLNDLKSKIHDHDPSGSSDVQRALKKSLLWLRDELRDLQCNQKCRHDAAADLIHVYAHTKSFFRIREYKSVTSPPVFISPLDLGPKYKDKLGEGGHEYCKTYGENYCLGQLIFWHVQTNTEPDNTLFRSSRGCLSLPDIGSFYAKVQKPSRQRVYGPRTVRFMLARMKKQPQRPWPKDRIWSFKSSPKVFGSPMLDSVLKNYPLEREMVQWLKNRTSVFQAMWDQ